MADPTSSEPVLPKKAVSSILLVGSASILAQLINVMATPLLSRLYAPQSFAIWALFQSVAVLFTTIAAFRYELAILLPKRIRHGATAYHLALSITAATTLFSAALFFLYRDKISDLLSAHEIAKGLLLIPFLILATGIIDSSTYWLTRMSAFSTLATFNVALVVVTVTVQMILALRGGAHDSGLILGTAIGQTVIALSQWLYLRGRYKQHLSERPSVLKLFSIARKYKDYPLHMTPYTVAGVLKERVVVFLLGAYSGRLELGYYAFTGRMVNMPTGLLAGAMRPVLFKQATRLNREGVSRLVYQTVIYLSQVLLPLWIFVIVQAPVLFGSIFGEAWRPAGTTASLLMIPAYFLILVGWMDRLFDVFRKQRLASVLQTLFLLASLGAFFIGLRTLNDYSAALSLYCGIVSLHYICILGVLLHLLRMTFAQIRNIVGITLGMSIGIYLPLSLISRMGSEQMACGLSFAATGILSLLLAKKGWARFHEAWEE